MTTVNKIVAYAKSLTNQLVSVPTNPYGSQCVVLIDDIVQHFTDKNLAYTNAIDSWIRLNKMVLQSSMMDQEKHLKRVLAMSSIREKREIHTVILE